MSSKISIPLARPIDAVRLCDSLEVLPVSCGCAAQHLRNDECMHVVCWCRCVYRRYVCFHILPATTPRRAHLVVVGLCLLWGKQRRQVSDTERPTCPLWSPSLACCTCIVVSISRGCYVRLFTNGWGSKSVAPSTTQVDHWWNLVADDRLALGLRFAPPSM